MGTTMCTRRIGFLPDDNFPPSRDGFVEHSPALLVNVEEDLLPSGGRSGPLENR